MYPSTSVMEHIHEVASESSEMRIDKGYRYLNIVQVCNCGASRIVEESGWRFTYDWSGNE